MRSLLFAVCATLLCSSQSRAGQVVIVDGPAAGTCGTLQAAIDVALDGDILLVGPGNYAAFTLDRKGLSIFAMPNAAVVVDVPMVIRNTPAGSTVVVHGLRSGSGSYGSDALVLQDDAGQVRIQDCVLKGRVGQNWPARGGSGVNVSNCQGVVLTRCTASGGTGLGSGGGLTPPGHGGQGVLGRGSSVALHDCDARGGTGGYGGGSGGHGVDLYYGVAFAAGSEFHGGTSGIPVPAWGSGSGGDGLRSVVNQLQVLDNLYFRGGPPYPYSGPVGYPLYSWGGSLVQHPGLAREMIAPAIVSDEVPFDVSVSGEFADVAWLRRHVRSCWFLDPNTVGPRLVPLTPVSQLVPLGVLPQGGPALVTPRPVVAPKLARLELDQLVVANAQGARFLGTPWQVLVFDAAAGPDCNGNAIPDAFDIATGSSLDSNGDGVPDECP